MEILAVSEQMTAEARSNQTLLYILAGVAVFVMVIGVIMWCASYIKHTTYILICVLTIAIFVLSMIFGMAQQQDTETHIYATLTSVPYKYVTENYTIVRQIAGDLYEVTIK